MPLKRGQLAYVPANVIMWNDAAASNWAAETAKPNYGVVLDSEAINGYRKIILFNSCVGFVREREIYHI
jgi:hypothetical protein